MLNYQRVCHVIHMCFHQMCLYYYQLLVNDIL